MTQAFARLRACLQQALIGAILLLMPALAAAGSYSFNTLTFGNAIDGGPSYGWTLDGNFDAMTETYNFVYGAHVVKVTRSDGDDSLHFQERRAVWEFAIPALLKEPGLTITNATFIFKKSQYGFNTLTGNDVLEVSGYVGDGQVSLADFAQIGTPIWATPNNPGPYFYADVTSYLNSIVVSAGHVGFVVSVDSWETAYELDNNVTLQVEYTVSDNAPPVVTVTSPAPGSQFTTGSPITFQGTSVDPEGGAVTPLNWQSSISGYIGTGSSVTTSALPAGTHTVTANSYDNVFQGGQASVSITVVAPPNSAPVVTILSPADQAVFTAGSPITFQGTAYDPEGTPVSAITWMSVTTGAVIGTGSTVTTSTLPAGSHAIRATVTDSTGLAGHKVIWIQLNAAPPPPPPQPGYCEARGTTSTYEYIKTVAVGAWSNTSNNNGGYGNFTASPAVSMSTGANSVTLTPGFSGNSYSEQWGVWIDFNQDLAFTANELVFSGWSPSAISTTITVPATALLGQTRMRVAMMYSGVPGPCGSFTYGEVEDYTVNITAGAPPPPPPPPPPPASYCASKGNTASYEWIQQVTVAGTVRSSGNNAGYANFTANPAIALARGANTIALQAGGGYSEAWRVWIDFNMDSVFSDSEMVYTGFGAGTLSSSITVPATAFGGNTRMRISMKYGSSPTACETFTWGEVEDYTVSIP